MRISAKAEYACIAVLDLARRKEQVGPVRLHEIAEPNGIPERFLVQILLQLKGAGYTQSLRGAGGGYRLAVDPQNISVWDIVNAIDGPSAGGNTPDAAHHGLSWQVIRELWHSVNRHEEELLKQTSFADLIESMKQQSPHMYYI